MLSFHYMMYLIGGPPRSGKTTLAKKLASRLRIGWVSADTLESIIREYIPRAALRKLFPKNVLREKTHGSNDEMYEKFSVKEITEAYIRQGKASRKAVETFVADCIKEGHDFVIEGHQIHPELVAKLSHRFPKEIKSAFLIKKDVQRLVDGFQKNTAKSDWVLRKTKNTKTFEKIAQMLSFFGKRIEKEAREHQLPVYSTDDNFVKTIGAIGKELSK
jgi:2-phosphoglycerate kinase